MSQYIDYESALAAMLVAENTDDEKELERVIGLFENGDVPKHHYLKVKLVSCCKDFCLV